MSVKPPNSLPYFEAPRAKKEGRQTRRSTEVKWHIYSLSTQLKNAWPPGYWRSKNASGYNFYYRCVAHDGTIVNLKCPLPQFRFELVDAAVWQWVIEFLTNPNLLEQGMAAYQAEQEVKTKEFLKESLLLLNSLPTSKSS